MSFGNDDEPNSDQFSVFLFLVLIVLSMPLWMPHCVPNQQEACEFICEKVHGQEFVAIYRGTFLNSCGCGKSLPRKNLILRP